MPDPRRFEQLLRASVRTASAPQKLLIVRDWILGYAGEEHTRAGSGLSGGEPQRRDTSRAKIAKCCIEFHQSDVGALHRGPARRTRADDHATIRRIDEVVE